MLFEEPNIESPKGSAYIVLGGGHSVDEQGNRLLTPDCGSVEELEHYINNFKHDLERILVQARLAFQKASTSPFSAGASN
jgi:hypothetical protein